MSKKLTIETAKKLYESILGQSTKVKRVKQSDGLCAVYVAKSDTLEYRASQLHNGNINIDTFYNGAYVGCRRYDIDTYKLLEDYNN